MKKTSPFITGRRCKGFSVLSKKSHFNFFWHEFNFVKIYYNPIFLLKSFETTSLLIIIEMVFNFTKFSEA